MASQVMASQVVAQNPEENVLNDILSLIAVSSDEYWRNKHNQSGSLPPELEQLRKFALTSNISLKQLAELATTLDQAPKKSPCFKEFFEFIIKASKRENTVKVESGLSKMVREANFYRDLKIKKEELAKALKTNDKKAEARANYELGVLLYKRDSVKYYKEAIEYLNTAISLNASPEIKAYALRERAALEENEEDKIKDLKSACEILIAIKEFHEKEHIKERSRTYIAYGERLILLRQFSEAIPHLLRALELRPENANTIAALLQAYGGIKKYENALECLRDLKVDLKLDNAKIKSIEGYFQSIGKSLWLEAASFGSVALLDFFANALDDSMKAKKDREENTALHLAAKEGHIEATALLERSISHDTRNQEGFTPVMVAARYGRVALVLELLFKRGVNPLTDKIDVLSVIIREGQACVLEALMNEGKHYHELLAKIGKLYSPSGLGDGKEKHEALMVSTAIGHLYRTAIESRNLIMLKMVVLKHPEGLRFPYKKDLPLHYAIRVQYNNDAVYLLVEHLNNLEEENSDKEKPMDVAKKCNPGIEGLLTNTLNKIKLKQKNNRDNFTNFIATVMKEFEGKLTKEMANLKNPKNSQKLKEALGLILDTVQHQTLFDEQNMGTTQILSALLVTTLLEKIQKKDEITKKTLINGIRFDREKLISLIQLVVNSSWQVKTPVKPEVSTEARGDRKSSQEPKMLSPTAVVFCERFEKQLDEAYGYFRAVAIGELVPIQDIEDQRKIELARQISSHLPTVNVPLVNVPLPVGGLISGVMDLMLYFRQRYRKKQAERMVNLFKAVTPFERTHFIRYTAEQLADKYHHQIHHLTAGSEGVEQFADCAAARVVEYITSDDSHQVAYEPSRFSEAIRVMKSWILSKEIPPEQRHQKSLYDIFLHGIVRVTSQFPKDSERLHTINHLTLKDNWNSKGIFENTGVELITGERYAHLNVDVDRYGYCKGTREEAVSRTLTLGPNPDKGHFWGVGRQWEAPSSTLALMPIDQTSSGKMLVTAYQSQQQQPGAQVHAGAESKERKEVKAVAGKA